MYSLRTLSLSFALLLLSSFVMLSSCKPGTPHGILSSSQLEEILYDYHLAQSAAEVSGGDVDKLRYYYVQKVFEKHGITEAEFDSSMVWYSANAKILRKMYERIEARFEAESKTLGVGLSDTELYANMSGDGDTANIWSGAHFLCLQNDRLNNITTITMPSDTTFRAGDNYRLSFACDFVGTAARQAYAMLHVRFKDGSSKFNVSMLNGRSDAIVSLPADITERRVTERITITFYYPPQSQSSERGFMVITNPALLRMHPAEEKPAIKSADKDSLRGDSIDVAQPSKTDSTRPSHNAISPNEFREAKPIVHDADHHPKAPAVERRVKNGVRRVVRRPVGL